MDHSIPPADFFSGRCFDTELDLSDLPPPRFPLKSTQTSADPIPTTATAASAFKPLIPKVPMRSSAPMMPISRPAHAPPYVSTSSRNAQVSISHAASSSTTAGEEEKIRFWTAQWRKPSTKKNKSWDGDGYLSQQGPKVVFMNENSVMWVLFGTEDVFELCCSQIM